ncbi:MAG: hypothetical protein ACJ74O_02485 [Frankiaceae bacterium]
MNDETHGDLRKDAAAALAARHELGPEYDQHLVDSFADRIEAAVARRASGPPAREPRRSDRLAVYGMTLAFGIPLTAIAGGIGHLPGLAIAWAGIAVSNVAHALGDRSKPR